MFLTNEQKKKYKIMSRKSAERYCTQKHDIPSIIISIRSSWDKILPDLPKTETNNVKAILSLAFDDIDKEDNPKHAMQEKDGIKIANFIIAHSDIPRIIIHCDGGMSRSAGVAAAIMRVREGNDYPIFDSSKKYPNMTCYLMTLKGFGYI